MAREKPKAAFAYLRTSSAANVGVDKDSAKRQREAIATFAKRAGYEILAEFNDEAISGADSLESRPGFAAMLERIEANGCKTILVETASRFARDLMVQEVGYARLQERSIELIAVDSPGSFQDDGPTAKLVRQVLGAVAEFDKAMTVAKLRGARERKRKTGKDKMLDGRTGKCEGRKALHETAPEAVLMAKRLRRANPISGDRMSLQRIAEQLSEAGYLNERGTPYNPKSVLAMVNGPRPKSAGADAE
jgi:DNA invertase Pin-like site-specific DNA recombinase